MMRRILSKSLLTLLGGLLFLAFAQQPRVLRGRVVDDQGNGIANLTISLHRVTDQGGAETRKALSGPDGRFEMPVPEVIDPEALYFVATRYRGDMFLGQPFRAPFETDREYVVVVGAGGTSATEMMQQEQQAAPGAAPAPQTVQPDAPRDVPVRVVLAILLIIGAAAVAAVLLARRRAAHDPRRAILLQIAQLDEEHAGNPADETYAQQRAAALARLGANAAG